MTSTENLYIPNKRMILNRCGAAREEGDKEQSQKRSFQINLPPFNKNADNASIAGEASLFVCVFDRSDRGLRELFPTF